MGRTRKIHFLYNVTISNGELNNRGNEKNFIAYWWYVNGRIYELNTMKNILYVHTIHFTNGSYSVLFGEYNFVKS